MCAKITALDVSGIRVEEAQVLTLFRLNKRFHRDPRGFYVFESIEQRGLGCIHTQ